MNEDKIKVFCPQCGKSTLVKKEGKPNRIIKCSNQECGFTGSMMLYTQKRTKEEASTSSPSETKLMINPQDPAMSGFGTLKVLSTGMLFPLKTGSNIIGRQHPTGHADIAIPCDDYYMSRHHIKIEGVPINNGIEYRLSDNNSTNKVKLNGSLLPQGDIVVLKPNDRIVIGHTEIEFILQTNTSANGQTLIY